VSDVRLGLRANAAQFALLVGLNALVGSMVGLERSVLPLVGKRDFHLASHTAILSFVVAFGAAKALTNLGAGALADRVGRRRLLVLGWLLGLPVAPLIALAPSWWLIVAANLLLGANQGLAWSMTVVMKIDLAGPARRGLALGLNESAGYLGVAATALASGALAATIAPRTVVWVGALAIAVVGTLTAVLFVRDTGLHVTHEQRGHGERKAMPLRTAFSEASLRHPVLRACSQAGLVNNLNDALAWGLAPLYLAAHGASAARIGVVAAVYPGVWGLLQLVTGWLSDRTGRKPLIAVGMIVQAGALALLVAGGGAFWAALAAAGLLGLGTALVYPTLIAAVSDVVQPRDRASVVGVYRFWRDSGFVAGALLSGLVADALGSGSAIAIVAVLTAASGLWVSATPWTTVAEDDRTIPADGWNDQRRPSPPDAAKRARPSRT
jgi:MFS family permease